MGVRKLFAIFIAVAMLLAPAFSRAGEAIAADFNGHHTQMVESEPCKSPPSDSDKHEKAAEKSSCISMCMGVAVTPPASGLESAPAPTAAVSPIPPLHVAFIGEIATPPPKFD